MRRTLGVAALAAVMTVVPACPEKAAADRLPPSPTEGVDLVNGPPENRRDRYGWYGSRLAIPDYIVTTCENHAADPTLKIKGWHPTRRSASGLYMFVRKTWNWYAGYEFAHQAPVYLQHQKAALLWAGGKGKSDWSSCL